MGKEKTMTLEEAMTVTEADKIKAILDMAKRSVTSLYDRLVKDIGEARRTKEKLESALHDAAMEASAMVNTIVKSTNTMVNVNTNDFANALVAWRMRFKEEQESVKSMVEVNDTSFDKTSELLQLNINSQLTDSSTTMSTIFDVVDKASYVYQRQRAFEEKYRDYIPLVTKIDNLSNELNKVNSRLNQSRRDLAYLDDINNYLFDGLDVPTLANSSSIIDKIRAINIKMASQNRPVLLTLVNNPSSMAGRIRSIETDMTPQDRFFLMAALVIVMVTRK